MDVYLQDSPIRHSLQATVDMAERNEEKYSQVYVELRVRVRLLSATFSGIVQVIQCYGQWMILSVVSFVTLGGFPELEMRTSRLASLGGSALVGIFIATLSLVHGVPAVKLLSHKISVNADRKFHELGITFVEEIYKKHQGFLKKISNSQRLINERFIFIHHTVENMLKHRSEIWEKWKDRYEEAPDLKYDVIVQAQTEMSICAQSQKIELDSIPFTQEQINREIEAKAARNADETLDRLYQLPRIIWEERIRKWGTPWSREGYAQRCFTEFRSRRIDRAIQAHLRSVFEAKDKEAAFARFEQDLEQFARKVQWKMELIELPPLHLRVFWFFRTLLFRSSELPEHKRN